MFREAEKIYEDLRTSAVPTKRKGTVLDVRGRIAGQMATILHPCTALKDINGLNHVKRPRQRGTSIDDMTDSSQNTEATSRFGNDRPWTGCHIRIAGISNFFQDKELQFLPDNNPDRVKLSFHYAKNEMTRLVMSIPTPPRMLARWSFSQQHHPQS